MRDLLNITKALADTQRLRLLLALQGGELCVCQLVELLGLANSTVSRHLSLLNQAGLVQSRKSERWVHYRLPDKEAPVEVREALDWMFKSLQNSPEAMKDRQQLKRILKLNPSTLCKRQCRN